MTSTTTHRLTVWPACLAVSVSLLALCGCQVPSGSGVQASMNASFAQGEATRATQASDAAQRQTCDAAKPHRIAAQAAAAKAVEAAEQARQHSEQAQAAEAVLARINALRAELEETQTALTQANTALENRRRAVAEPFAGPNINRMDTDAVWDNRSHHLRQFEELERLAGAAHDAQRRVNDALRALAGIDWGDFGDLGRQVASAAEHAAESYTADSQRLTNIRSSLAEAREFSNNLDVLDVASIGFKRSLHAAANELSAMPASAPPWGTGGATDQLNQVVSSIRAVVTDHTAASAQAANVASEQARIAQQSARQAAEACGERPPEFPPPTPEWNKTHWDISSP